MKCCGKCKWLRYDKECEKVFMCNRNPTKKFNHPKLHGWFCKHRIKELIECTTKT